MSSLVKWSSWIGYKKKHWSRHAWWLLSDSKSSYINLVFWHHIWRFASGKFPQESPSCDQYGHTKEKEEALLFKFLFSKTSSSWFTGQSTNLFLMGTIWFLSPSFILGNAHATLTFLQKCVELNIVLVFAFLCTTRLPALEGPLN